MKKLIMCTTIVMTSFTLGGCIGGAASAVGQGVASEAVSSSLQIRAANNMTCEQIEEDISTRNMGKINPLAIPSINRQISRMEAVAKEKGCPGFTDEEAAIE